MKKLTILALFIYSCTFAESQTVRTVGGGSPDYATLKEAFDAINTGSITGIIVLQINGSTTETASAVLNASGSGSASYTSVRIYPTTAALTISGNIGGPLINLNGADKVTIDGRVNATGSTKSLTITNTSTGNSSASAIQFIESAQNDTVKYCTLKSSSPGTSQGVVFFSTATTGTGNDNNIIDNNDITNNGASVVVNGIASLGTATRENSSNTLSNNNLYDVWHYGVNSNAIFISSNSTDFTITGNSIYQTSGVTTFASRVYDAIRIVNTSGNNFVVSGNYIGGRQAQCGGAAMTLSDSYGSQFQAIYLSVGSTTPTSVQGNVIKNMNFTVTATNPWQTIYVNAGAVNIGTVTGNTIGAATGTGSIQVITANGSNVYGIYIGSTGTVDCENNTIGAFTTNSTNANYACNFFGIYKAGFAGTTTISNNLIGSTVTASSINTSSTSTANPQRLYGIGNDGTGTIIISNNTVANLTNTTNNITTSTVGVNHGIASTAGTMTISNNTVHDLTIANGNTSTNGSASVIGISLAGATTKNLAGNTVYNLSNTYSGFAGNIIGIYYNGSTTANAVSGNLIHSLTVNASSTAAIIYGILIAGGSTTFSNNIVNLGGNTATTLCGIYEYGASGNNNRLYFNTVYLSGSLGSGVTNKSYALYSSATSNIRNFRNNIFDNARSTTSGSNLHYAAYFNYGVSTQLTLDYNDYYAPGTGGTLGYYNSSNKTSTPIVTGLDASSSSANPVFSLAGGTSANDYVISATLNGVAGSGVTSDFNSITRGSPPKMGALEGLFYTWVGGTSSDFATASNWSGGVVPGAGANVVFSASPSNNCVLDQSRTIGSITNAQSTYKLDLNGKQLNISGNLIFSNGAQIDASTAASAVAFTGTSAQTIPSGAFVNNTLPILIVNNSAGITLAGSLNVTSTLTLTSGTFTVGANTFTFSGTSVSRTAGNMDVSNSSGTLNFNNSSAIVLPASVFSGTINNLTLGGSGGITAGGNITVNGILNLQSTNPSVTAGILDMSTYALTMGATATTTGSGDVTGIVTRTSFVANTSYTFGNQYTILTLASGGVLPSSLSVKIILVSSNISWKNNAIRRYYDVIQTGGNSSTKVTMKLHYLDSELNGATENNMDLFDYHESDSKILEDHGHSNANTSENWVGLANLDLTYIAPTSVFPSRYWTLGTSTEANFTWTGANSTDWANTANWVGAVVPGSGDAVTIPDAGTTTYDPTLPASTTIGSMSIESGGILNGGSGTALTLNNGSGAWSNNGTFNAGTSAVTFTHSAATISGTTDFNDLIIANGSSLTPGTESIIRIAGVLTLNGTAVLNAGYLPNTIEYNGSNQTVINPNGNTAGYYHLILSGSGTKTMPATSLTTAGNFSLSGTATATAGSAVTVKGNTNIGSGSTFTTGNYNHVFLGNFTNDGTFTASAGYGVSFTGTSAQTIGGSSDITFDNLTINNSFGVSLQNNVSVNNLLTLTSGNLGIGNYSLTLNGTISRTSGNITGGTTSSMVFGGSAALTLPSDLFSVAPTLKDLTINRSGGVVLGNQSMTLVGLLTLTSGTLTVGANTFTISGSSPVRTTGTIDASNATSTLVFENDGAIVLPAGIFTSTVTNITTSGLGGITVSSDFTLTGILNLQRTNPSETSGILNMWDGAAMTTLTMGANATTIGPGDVTGIVKRTTILPNIAYTFGNQYMTAFFPNAGTLPTMVALKISIGTEPAWLPGGVKRDYEVIQTGGNNTKAVFTSHYLDNELNGNDETKLVLWVKGPIEYGRSSYNTTENWVRLSNINMAFFSSSFDNTKNVSIDESLGATTLTWNGSVSTSWTTPGNWTPNAGPAFDSNIIIPHAATVANLPSIPALAAVNTVTLEAGAILNADAGSQLTLNGSSSAWLNAGGTFNASTGAVIFTNANATISGNTIFNNVTINSGASLSMENGSTMVINGVLTNSGTFNAVTAGNTTVEYAGASQTVVNPNSSDAGYYNLILSGSGTKTLPSEAMTIGGDFNIKGSATATAGGALTTLGNLTLDAGTTFTAGAYNHSIGGKFTNNGAFTGTGSTYTFNGTTAQTIAGASSTTFNNFVIDNSQGVSLETDQLTTISGNATINSGKKFEIGAGKQLTINGTFTNNATSADFTIRSTVYGSGSLISGNAVAGTVEQYHTDSSYIYHMVSPPISNATAASYKFDGILTYLYSYDPAVPGWNNIKTSATALTAGQGYLVNYHSSAVDKTSVYVGTINAAGFSATLSALSVRYNLVGNPYPCAIDWDAFVPGSTRQNLNNAYYIWLPAKGNYGSYLSGAGGTLGVNNIIPSGQGFFVYSGPGNPVLTFESAVKTHNISILKSAMDIPPKIRLSISNNVNTYKDETAIYFSPKASLGFDGEWDAPKMGTLATESSLVFTQADGKNIAINGMPENYHDSIPLYFKCNKDATYSLELIENTWTDSIYLTDIIANKTVLLKEEPYSFSATKADTIRRFVLNRQKGAHSGTGINTGKEKRTDIIVFVVDHKVYLENKSDKEYHGELIIHSMDGREIFVSSSLILGTRLSADLPASGVYLVTFRAREGTFQQKVIVY